MNEHRTLRPAGTAPRSRAALALILTAAFVVVLDFSIVNVALASIERELHASSAGAQWVITAYAVTFGGLLVFGGRLGDLWGRRRMFVAGLVTFSLASLAGGLATGIDVLVVARALQGAGAAIVAPAALSLVTTSIPEGPARTRALGLYGATAAVGFAAGLVLGGVLVQLFDWRAVLWVNVPIGLVAAALAPRLLPRDRSEGGAARLDVAGAVLVTGAIAALVEGISQGAVGGWLSASALAGFGLALVLGVAFVAVELHTPAPLVRLGILRQRRLRTANVVTLLLGAWSAAELLTVPLYFQLVLHYSPLVTGLAMVPQGIVGFLGATRGASLLRRVGTRTFLVGSAVAAGIGLGVLGVSLAARDYPFLFAGLAFAGYGTATGAFAATVAATREVADGEQGLASGLVNMSRQVGAAIGVAVTAAIIGTSGAAGGSVGPDGESLVAAAAAAGVAAVVGWRALRLPPAAGRARRPAPGGVAAADDPAEERRPAA